MCAIALSIGSVPVAAPAPGHDLRRTLDSLLARARENAESVGAAADLVRPSARLDNYIARP